MSGRRSGSLADRFWPRVNKSDGCWEWDRPRPDNGYGQIAVDGRPRYAHRVAWELEHGAIPVGLFVCHRCDNPRCVRPAHLFLGSALDNQSDAARKERKNKKLTADDCRTIIALRAGGTRLRDIASRFGVSEGMVSMISRGRRRREVMP